MTATAKLESEVAEMRRESAAHGAAIEAQVAKIDALAIDLESVTGQARDLSLIKKLAIGVISMVVPSLGAGAVNLIQGAQRLEQVEHRLEASLEERADLANDLNAMKTDVRLVATEIQRRRDEDATYLRRLLERLDAIEQRRRR